MWFNLWHMTPKRHDRSTTTVGGDKITVRTTIVDVIRLELPFFDEPGGGLNVTLSLGEALALNEALEEVIAKATTALFTPTLAGGTFTREVKKDATHPTPPASLAQGCVLRLKAVK